MLIEAIHEWRARKGWLSDLKDPARWVFDWLYGGGDTSSGISVGPRNALESTPALRAIRLICEAMSSVPWNLMERDEEGRKKILRDDDTYFLLHSRPNEMMTSAVFRQVVQLHALTHGCGYVFIERNAVTRRPVALLPLDSGVTRALREKGRYFVRTHGDDGRAIELNPADVAQIPWLSWDGINGESPVRTGRRSLGLGMAAEESAAKFFGQGMLSSGVIEQVANNSLKPEGLDNLKKAIEAKFSGLANAHRPMLLEPGLTWKQASVDMDKAQAKELREMNVADVARIYGVPLHLLAAGDKTSTYASVEQFELIFIKHTMLPWYFLWEQEFDSKLLTREERKRRFTKFNLEGLLRGDKKSRAEANEIEARNGALFIDEWRDSEDRDPSGLPEAKQPLAMVSQLGLLKDIGKRPIEPKTAPASPTREENPSVRALYEQQARKCLRQLCDSLAKISAKFSNDRAAFETEIGKAIDRIAEDFSLFDSQIFARYKAQALATDCPASVLQVWKALKPDDILHEVPR